MMQLIEPVIVVCDNIEVGRKWASQNLLGNLSLPVVTQNPSSLRGQRNKIIFFLPPVSITADAIASLESRNILVRISKC